MSRVVFAAGGAIETALLPYHLMRFRAAFRDVDVDVVISAGGLRFATSIALEGITEHHVYDEEALFAERSSVPAHIHLSSADLVVLYPATARIIAECALGIVSCPVTRCFAFAPRDRAIITPYLHPSMTPDVYLEHLATLEASGVTIVRPTSGPFWLQESAWVATQEAIRRALGLLQEREVPPVYALGPRQFGQADQ